MDKQWITTKELAFLKNISERAVRKSISKNKYVTRKIGKSYEILITTLDIEIQNKISLCSKENNILDVQRTISEKEKNLALAKYDLVHKWREYKLASINKTESSKDFLILYNKKFVSHKLFEVLKKVSISSLYRWDKKLNENNDNWQVLLNNYTNNANRSKSILKPQEEEIFLSLLLHPNQTNIGKATKLTKHILKERGFEDFACDLSYRRYAEKYKKEHYDVWVFSREGNKALKDKVIPYLERDTSKIEVGDVLVGDGHRLAFQVINPFSGKPCRPTIVAYQDWKSGAMVGFEIMLEENTQCIASALRNSIINLGKIPQFVYQDNGKAFKSKYFIEDETLSGLFANLGIKPIFAKPYNAKAKVIERFFREMQDSFERLLPSFVGSCINNQPAYLKRNEKFHKKLHKNYIPTMQEVSTLINKWLSFHYSQPCTNVKGKTIGEVFESGKGSGVNVTMLDDLMMAAEIKKISRNGIRFLKSDYYDEILYGLRDKVIIKYSLFDLSQVKVYTTKGKFLCIANRAEAVNPIANYIGTPKDIEELKQRLKQQKQLEKDTVKKYLKDFRSEKIYLPLIEDDMQEYKDENVYAISQCEKVETKKSNIFENKYQKYEWLISQNDIGEIEKAWINEYEKTEEYALIFGLNNVKKGV